MAITSRAILTARRFKRRLTIMYVDVVLRLSFFGHHGNIERSLRVVYPSERWAFAWDTWVDAVGYPPQEREDHAVLIGPPWVGTIDLCYV